jgi:hypothetical protein
MMISCVTPQYTINHLYSHKRYIIIMITEDIHMYIYYNKYKMDIHIRVYTIYTIGTGV